VSDDYNYDYLSKLVDSKMMNQMSEAQKRGSIMPVPKPPGEDFMNDPTVQNAMDYAIPNVAMTGPAFVRTMARRGYGKAEAAKLYETLPNTAVGAYKSISKNLVEEGGKAVGYLGGIIRNAGRHAKVALRNKLLTTAPSLAARRGPAVNPSRYYAIPSLFKEPEQSIATTYYMMGDQWKRFLQSGAHKEGPPLYDLLEETAQHYGPQIEKTLGTPFNWVETAIGHYTAAKAGMPSKIKELPSDFVNLIAKIVENPNYTNLKPKIAKESTRVLREIQAGRPPLPREPLSTRGKGRPVKLLPDWLEAKLDKELKDYYAATGITDPGTFPTLTAGQVEKVRRKVKKAK